MQKFSQHEWEALQNTAKQKFIANVLGERPTFDKVNKQLYNNNPIGLLEWLALALLLVISIVTAFKMSSVALPFAESFFPNAPQWVVASFQVATATMFILMSTSGLIYYKLMDETDPEVEVLKHRYNKLKFSGGWQGAVGVASIVGFLAYWIIGSSFDQTAVATVVAFVVSLYFGGAPTNLMQYLSPRLFLFLTYTTAIWLFSVSSHGNGTFFEKYLVVFAEIALAYLVANLITKYNKRSADVQEALEQRLKPYDDRLEGYETDPAYLRILYQDMREAFLNLLRPIPSDVDKRRPRLYKPNAKIEDVDDALYTEYLRLTGGLQFAKRVLSQPDAEVVPQTVIGKRRPPSGDQKWTVGTLEHDFIIRGLKPNDEYSEQQLATDYEGGYSARSAYRAGAKLYFTK